MEELESFYFKETIDGDEHDYRITMDDCVYNIEKDGKLLAVIQCDETWKQISGEAISEDVIQFIGHAIDAYFD